MNIIFYSIFFLRLRICSRHKCRFHAEFGQSLRDSGQFECWECDGERKELGGYDGNEKGWFVVQAVYGQKLVNLPQIATEANSTDMIS